MKKLLLISLLCYSVLGNSQILSQDFQGATFPPTGWTTATNVAARPWGLTTTVFNAAGQTTFNITGISAGIGWIAQAQDANLTSPSFSLVGQSAASLTFKAKLGYEFMVSPIPSGDLNLRVSTNGGTVWTTIWREEDYGTFTDYQTLSITLPLTAYLGQANVKIQFQYVGNDADSVSIDDILVQNPLSVSNIVSNKFFTSPNPANDIINISNSESINVKSVSITDLNGRVIKNINFNNVSEINVNVSDLSSGMYLMNISSDQGIATKKIIKE